MLIRVILPILIYLSTSPVASADSGMLDVYIRKTNSTLGVDLASLFGKHGDFAKSYALIIGVGKYNAFPQLDAPSSDAVRVRNFLRDEADFDYIVTMTDEQATRENIEKYMETLFPSLIKNNDRFLFYFSGHGTTRQITVGKRGYLVLSASVKDQWDTMIDMPRVNEWSQNVEGAKHTLFLIDACFSGLTAVQAKDATEKMTLERLLRPAHHLITAGVEGEESYSAGGESLFTSAFISAARGQAGNNLGPLISLDDIMVGINRLIDAKRGEIGDLKMTPHLYLTKIDDNAGEFFFLNRALRATPQAIVTPRVKGGALHVLAIGIDHFGERAGGLHLDYAANDARDVALALTESQNSLYSEVMPEYLYDEKAGRREIFESLDGLARTMGKGGSDTDVAVIFFSGHSVLIERELYLIPYGVDVSTPTELQASSIWVEEFAAKVKLIAERGKVLLLVDACHSGEVGPSGTSAADAGILRDAVNMDNVTVLTCSLKDELSHEDPAFKHGAFTQVFLNAVAGGADPSGRGVISTVDLAKAMNAELGKLTMGKQHLGMHVNFDDDVFVVSR